VKNRVVNTVVLFVLCEWLLPSLFANFGIPEAPIRVVIFAVFIVALLAMIAVRNTKATE
jgi:hypothetical protein